MLDLALSTDQVDFRDIEDPGAFVHATINKWQRPTGERGPIPLSQDEREELHAEGMAILCKLARDFRPHMDGYDQEGWFSGYAAMFLPRKLGDAWHRMHPDHLLVTDPETGKRRWQYKEKAVSLDALTGDDPDRQPLMASPSSQVHDYGPRIAAAWRDQSRRDLPWIVDVARLISRGVSPAETAARLGLTEDIVRRYMRSIVRAAPAADHQFAKLSELRAAVEAQTETDADMACRVGDLFADGATDADVAQRLEVDMGEVRDYKDVIRMVWPRVESKGETE